MLEDRVMMIASSLIGQGTWKAVDEEGFLLTDCGGFVNFVLSQVLSRSGQPQRFQGDQAFWRSLKDFVIVRNSWSEDQITEYLTKRNSGMHITTDTFFTSCPIDVNGITVAVYHTKGTNAAWGNFTHVGLYNYRNGMVYHLPDLSPAEPGVIGENIKAYITNAENSNHEVYILRLPLETIMNGNKIRDDAPEKLDTYCILTP